MADTNFFTMPSGQKSDLCKACETMHVNNYEPDTFLWLLQKYDIPWLPWEWNGIADTQYQKDPYKFNGMSVFGRYLSKMKLKQHKGEHWADSDRLQLEHQEKAKVYGTPEEQMVKKIADMQEAYENGEISEAQWLTYKEINEPRAPEFVHEGGAVTTAAPGGQNPYPVNDNPFEKVEIPSIADQLTIEDKIYLAQKWGRLYTADDWFYLEKKYQDFINSFDIQGAARIDTLIQICKLSLKQNQALDTGDVDSYSKLTRAYDALMKAAKFTEAQRKEEKAGEFDSIGQVVAFAEKYKSKIKRYSTATPLDKFDEAIDNLKRYNKELILNDPSLAQQLENYIKKREALEERKADEIKAAEMGLEHVEVSDEDLQAFRDAIAADKMKDGELDD